MDLQGKMQDVIEQHNHLVDREGVLRTELESVVQQKHQIAGKAQMLQELLQEEGLESGAIPSPDQEEAEVTGAQQNGTASHAEESVPPAIEAAEAQGDIP